MNYKNWLRILLVVFVFAIIFYQFGQIPKYLFYDELDFARLAVALSHQSYTPYSSLATGHSTLYFYILLGSLKLFGINTLALRLPAALFGIGSIFVFYQIIKRILNETYALTLAAIFISMRWYFNFARFSFEATFLVFLELTATFFCLKLLKKKQLRDAVLCGIFTGLAFHSYTPGRIFLIVPAVIIFLYARRFIVPFLATCLIIMSPLIFYFSQHPDTRIEKQMYFYSPEISSVEKTQWFATNIGKNLLMLIGPGDMNGRHNYTGKPAVNPIIFVFIVGGFIVTMKKWRTTPNQYFLLLFIISLIPAALSRPEENPNMLRTISVVPVYVYFVGNMIHALWNTRLPVSKKTLLYILIGLFLVSTIYELRTYFVFQKLVFIDDAFKIKKPLWQVLQ